MSSGRKSTIRPIEANMELIFDDFERYQQPTLADADQRIQPHEDEELDRFLARLKSQFAPQPAYLQEVKLEPDSSSDDPYLTGLHAGASNQLDNTDSVASVVEIEASSIAPTLNSTISRLANYLSDKHGGDFGNPIIPGIVRRGNDGQQQQKLQPQVLLKQQSDQPPAFLLHPQHVSVAAVKARLLSVDQEKRFSCYICQRRFHLFAHLRNHLETHTGEKSHECNQCGKCFATPTSLKRHEPIHHSDKKHRCNVCGKAYANQGYLKVHMRIHRNEKPFDCELCGRAFRQLAHLNHHLLTHTGDKPHKCDLCGQRFRQANTLEDHVRLHTGERPHSCSYCGKSFTHRLSLKLHMKYHAKDVELSGNKVNGRQIVLPTAQPKQRKQQLFPMMKPTGRPANQQQQLVEDSNDAVEIITD